MKLKRVSALALSVAASAVVGTAAAQLTTTPSTTIRNPTLSPPAPPRQPAQPTPSTSPFTTPLACPTDSTLSVTIPANRVPAGWSETSSGVVLTLAETGTFNGQQELACRYRGKLSTGGQVTSLRRYVSVGSCIIAPDKKSFLCKAGTM
jgi:hypothetical protein